MTKIVISELSAFEVLDSRGNPTVSVEVKLSDGSSSISFVPSGASTGKYEAVELRDGNKEKFNGKGVSKAVNFINDQIRDLLIGLDPLNQVENDRKLCDLDGTKNKSALGANSILAASLAILRASAVSKSIPLYEHVNSIHFEIFKEKKDPTLPVPMMNILNGGAHADNKIDFQEFMIQPKGFKTFRSAMQCGVEIYHNLKYLLKEEKLSTSIGDEGGFAPDLESAEQALEFILKAIDISGYNPGEEVFICLDPAASEFFNEGKYELKGSGQSLNSFEMVDYLKNLISKYPINSLEDGLDEDDWEGWKLLGRELGSKIQLVGDDVFATNPLRIERGIKEDVANSVLIKINQIGTVTEALKAAGLATQNNYKTVISHRSGETEDTSIADIAVGLSSGQIKTGAPSRTDRVSKYNRLLILEDKFNIPYISEYESR